MTVLKISLFVLVPLMVVLCYVQNLFLPPDIPHLNDDIWWGLGHKGNDNLIIKRFKISVPDEVIEDLQTRLKYRRPFKPSIKGTANQYGTNRQFLNEVIDFWINEYNWTKREEYLNKYPQFQTQIQGLDIHFIHVKPDNPQNKKVLPLLIVHGWPGSFVEFLEALDILSKIDRDYVLELVVPSLPGFGFSDAASKSGLSLGQTAILLKKLMNRLGHTTFYLQGGDLGALCLQMLCVLYPESVLGFHTNLPIVYTVKSYIKPILGLLWPSWIVKSEHYDRLYPLSERGLFIFRESGYLHMHCTKPDSLGVAIDDSPSGLAAYYLEKFIVGSNFSWLYSFHSDDMKRKFPYEKLIDNLMITWVTQAATTSFRIYYETFNQAIWSDNFNLLRVPIKTPTVIFRNKYDIYMADGVLLEIFQNILQLSDYDSGHFPAFEIPRNFTDHLVESIELFERKRRLTCSP